MLPWSLPEALSWHRSIAVCTGALELAGGLCGVLPLPVRGISIACLHQVHTNIVIFNLRDSCPLKAKDFIPLLQQHGVLIIPFRCTTCIFLQSNFLIHIMP